MFLVDESMGSIWLSQLLSMRCVLPSWECILGEILIPFYFCRSWWHQCRRLVFSKFTSTIKPRRTWDVMWGAGHEPFHSNRVTKAQDKLMIMFRQGHIPMDGVCCKWVMGRPFKSLRHMWILVEKEVRYHVAIFFHVMESPYPHDPWPLLASPKRN